MSDCERTRVGFRLWHPSTFEPHRAECGASLLARSAPVGTNTTYGGFSPARLMGPSVGDAHLAQPVAVVVGLPAQLDVSHTSIVLENA
jgi:hypothetical protein